MYVIIRSTHGCLSTQIRHFTDTKRTENIREGASGIPQLPNGQSTEKVHVVLYRMRQKVFREVFVILLEITRNLEVKFNTFITCL